MIAASIQGEVDGIPERSHGSKAPVIQPTIKGLFLFCPKFVGRFRSLQKPHQATVLPVQVLTNSPDDVRILIA